MKLTTDWHDRNQRRKPLRTFKEMAEEFGVSPGALAVTLGHSKLPKPAPALRHASATARTTWYDPDALRAWWAAHQAEKVTHQ